MTPTPLLLLASTSRYRRALLDRLRLPYGAVAPGVEEIDLPGEAPEVRALRLALAKANAVALQHPGSLVIGSDQVASLETPSGHRILHKPGNRENCRVQLREMSGRRACFDTAVAVIHGDVALTHVDRTIVQLRPLPDEDIERYMDLEPAFDCAGGFKCEGLGVSLFDSIESRDPTALVGLPLIWVCGALRRLGVPV